MSSAPVQTVNSPHSEGADVLLDARVPERNGRELTEEIIIRAAIAHFEKTKQWPSQYTADEIPLLPGDSWQAITSALRTGGRSLEAGRTLFELLKPVKEQYGSKVRNSPLSEEIIIQAAIEHFKRTERWPTKATPDEIPLLPGETWSAINAAGREGIRNLEVGRTLSVILKPVKLAHGSKSNGGGLSEEVIVKAAIEQHEKTGKWPSSGDKTSKIPLMPDDTWGAIDNAGRTGLRNLAEGRTLAKILEPVKREFGSKIRTFGQQLTEEIVVEAAIQHFKTTGRWPTGLDSASAIPLLPGDSWSAIDTAGRQGSRGLEKGRSLAVILAAEKVRYGSRVVVHYGQLSEVRIIDAAKEHFENTGRWPSCSDSKGAIPSLPGDNWKAIHEAGSRGNRGLEKGRTLSTILAPVKQEHSVSLGSAWLPREFYRERQSSFKPATKSTAALMERELGVSFREAKSITFMKGAAFEQLAGILLLSLYTQRQVIPQFCLDVDPKSGFYGMRADFRAGNTIYEVKWGAATTNIIETHDKHQKKMPAGMRYELILLNENAELELPYSRFSTLCKNSDLAQCLGHVNVHLLNLLEKNSTGDMQVFRDYLYGVFMKGNQFSGSDRIHFLETELNGFLGSDGSTEYMKAHRYALYCPLSAYFEYNGKLFSGLITPSVLQKENPEQFRTLYHFGPLVFADPLDRDIAAMCELAHFDGKYMRVTDLINQSEGIIESAVFNLPDGRILDRGNVSKLEDLKSVFSFEGDCFQFGVDYLAACGCAA